MRRHPPRSTLFPYATLFRSVPAAVEVQPGARDAAGQDAGVDQRDDRVVVAGEHQGRLPDEGEERQRSEEHTSELQSRQYLVCRLLLEKKYCHTTCRYHLLSQ